MKKIIYSLFSLLIMANASIAQYYNQEFSTELDGATGDFSDVVEVGNHYYAVGKGNNSIHYAKFNVNGALIWSKTIATMPGTVVGMTKLNSRIFISYSFESDSTLPVRIAEINTVNGTEINSTTVLEGNTLDLTHYSQLRTTQIDNHLFLVAGDTMVRYNPDNFNPEHSFSAPVLIHSTAETNNGGVLITHGFVNDSVTVVRRINEDTVIQSQYRYQFNIGHNRKLIRVGENKFRVFTYDSDTIRTWMVNDTCVDVGNNLFWRIWTSTNPTPDNTYEFEVTPTADSSFILSFKNVILFWGSQNNQGIYLTELHEHASGHQTIAKTIEDSNGEYVFVGKSSQGRPYISKLGDGVLNALEKTGKKELEFFVFPNPSSKYIHVSVGNNTSHNTNYQIIDTTGRIVLEGTCKGNLQTIDISALTPGIYNVVISGKSVAICKQ